MNNVCKTAAAVTAICIAAASVPAAAQDLPARAINALSLAIKSQGDAALVQVRRELKDTLRDHLQPLLPQPDAGTDTKSAPADRPKQ